jgi:hypothetical protein
MAVAYEYKVIEKLSLSPRLEDMLNDWGEAGWELISVFVQDGFVKTYICIFKRRLSRNS